MLLFCVKTTENILVRNLAFEDYSFICSHYSLYYTLEHIALHLFVTVSKILV